MPLEAFRHAIRPTAGASDLELVRPYLADLNGAREVLIVTTFGNSELFNWVVHENCRCKVDLKNPFIYRANSRDEVRLRMADLISRSSAERIVVIDAPHGRYSFPALGWTYDRMVGIVDAMEQQQRFVRRAVYEIPSHGAKAVVWARCC